MARIAPWALAALLASPRLAVAQSSSPEAAWRSLVASAVSAQSAGDHARALELAARALEAHETPSLQRFIATERLALGQLAAARGAAQRCVEGATADEHIPERAATLAACGALARDLEARVARVALRVPSPPPDGLRVTVGGVAVRPESLAVPSVVDAGEVAVSATAPGHAPFRRVVAARAGAVTEVDVALERATTTPPALRVDAPTVVTASPLARPSHTLRGGVALGAAIGGGAALVLGSIALGLGASAAARFNDDARCSQHAGVVYGGASCVDAANVADAMRPLAIGSFIGAGVLGALSAVLYATAPSRSEGRAHLACTPGFAGLVCDATF